MTGADGEDMFIAVTVRRGDSTQQQLADALLAAYSEARQKQSQASDDENVFVSMEHGINREQIKSLQAEAEEAGCQVYLVWNKEELNQGEEGQ